MATRTITVDDLTGRELEDSDVYKHEVTYNGDTYTLETTKANADKLDAAIIAYLSGEKTLPDFAQRSTAAKKATSASPSVDTYGLEFNEVRSWAVKNKMKGKGGDPIKDTTRRLHQGIYDAYKDAH